MTRHETPPPCLIDRGWRADGKRAEAPVTEESAPGTYIVITASRTVYHVDIANDSASWRITRYPRVNSLLLDVEPLTGVLSFFFDVESGMGQIEWWKGNVADRDDRDRPYAGTVRATSRVMLILSLNPTTGEMETVRLLLDGLRRALRVVDSDDEFVGLLTVLVQHGRDGPLP